MFIFIIFSKDYVIVFLGQLGHCLNPRGQGGPPASLAE